jgi:GT2 family glycosyltransferase
LCGKVADVGQPTENFTLDASLIIPTYNRRDALLETLRAVAGLDFPADRWEAVVVDDGSTDDTAEAVRAWQQASGAPVSYIRQNNAGPAAARNRGAALARGDVLLFMDNDIVVRSDFLRGHLEAHRANPGCWIVGRVVHPPQLRESPFGRYRDGKWEEFAAGYPSDRLSETGGLTGQNLSLPAADFRRLGGFDEGFTIASGEDWELGARARRAGIRILYHPGLVGLHNDWAVSLERYCERQRLYSKSDVLLWRKYGTASPRAELVRVNAPIHWRQDALGLIARKAVKGVLATAAGRRLARWGAGLVERLAPDTRLCRQAYEFNVALAIFRGVRDGWRAYPAAAVTPAAVVGASA